MSLTLPAPGTLCPALAREPFVSAIYGYPGVGKSPALSCLPDTFYIDLQLGTRYCNFPAGSRRVVVESYTDYIAACEAWRANRTTFVITDPITVLYDWAVQLATDEYISKPLGKRFGENGERTVLDLTASTATGQSFSPGYRFVRETFMRLVRMAWPQVSNRLICVGHVRDALMADVGLGEKGGKTSAEVNGKDLDIDGKLRNIFLSECDVALYMYRNALSVLKVTSQSTKAGSFVKCRCPNLLNRTFDFHTPTTLDDWRAIYPDSIAALCGPPASGTPAPVTLAPQSVKPTPQPPATPLKPLTATPLVAASVKP